MESYIKLFKRDLEKLKDELQAFNHETNLWVTFGDTQNCAGNLTLHLCGNLNHFIGAVIGGSGYVRDRAAEFAQKHVPLEDLLHAIDEVQSVVEASLEKMDKSLLQEPYPIDVFGEKMTYEYFLIHLVAHLNYHLGQINYLRRIIEQ